MPPPAPRPLLRAYQSIAFVGAIVLFGASCLIVGSFAVFAQRLLPAARARRLGRRLISRWFRFYFGLLAVLGLMQVDTAALDSLRDERGLLISANHPSLLDAMLIISRLEHSACVMKAAVLGNLFFGPIAQLAGYISNDKLRGLIRGVRAELAECGQVLLFPEGTRSELAPINPLASSFALIAAKAAVPVQALLIETNSPYLAKGWSILRMPAFPLHYRVRLGQRFAPPGSDHAAFMQAFENHLRAALAEAPLGGPRPGVPYAAANPR